MFRELADLAQLHAHASLDAVPSIDQIDPEQCYIAWDLTVSGGAKRQQIDAVFDWADGDCELTVARRGASPVSALPAEHGDGTATVRPGSEDRKSVVSGKSVSVRVDLGGRRLIKKKKNKLNIK